MNDLIRRFRGMGVALVVLALSAGAAFAAAPAFTPVGHTRPTVEEPSGEPEASADPDASGDVESPDQDVDQDEDAQDDADEDKVETEDASGNHGELVSTAAQASLDPRFENRGAWVSCVAKLGKDVTGESVDWATVTEDCVTAQTEKVEAKQAKHGSAKTKTHGAKTHSPKSTKTKTHGKPKG